MINAIESPFMAIPRAFYSVVPLSLSSIVSGQTGSIGERIPQDEQFY